MNDNPVSEGIWQTITEGMYAEYCQSDSNTLMFADQLNDKMAVTKDLLLSSGDIIQFRVRVNNSTRTNNWAKSRIHEFISSALIIAITVRVRLYWTESQGESDIALNGCIVFLVVCLY